MQEKIEQERELAALIIEALNLEDISVDDIQPEDPLFGDGLGLDSIDALELALAISRNYSVHMKAEDEGVQRAFATLRSLNEYIQERVA